MKHPVHLILSAGTRIVTRNDANRIGGGQLIAAGAVAVILNSPPDAQHAYKIRFNDGAEAMLRRNEFSILKEFKGEGIETTARGIDFEDWQQLATLHHLPLRRRLTGVWTERRRLRRGPSRHLPAAC
ncbi:MAG TPA: hypothetical protein VNU68_10355 [Verrucomicrobiae bacterium]|nr:hypothetical protein [Verrucomicrobiae bacterium]